MGLGRGDGDGREAAQQFPGSGKIYHLVGSEAAAELRRSAFAQAFHQHFRHPAHQAGVGRQGEFILKGLQAGQAFRLDFFRHLVREAGGPGFR